MPIRPACRRLLQQHSSWISWMIGAIAFTIPFLANYTFIIRHFYVDGAYFLDSGWLAALMWRSDLGLTNPTVVDGPDSFYSIHISPLLALASAISRVLPLGPIEFFALFQGMTYGSLSAAAYYFLTTTFKQQRVVGSVIAGLIAIAFAFSGLVISTIFYPHYEVAASSALIWFLIFWVQRRYRLAGIFFTLGLLVREDVGFHFVAVLGLVSLVRWIRGTGLSRQRATLSFLAIAFLYSCLAILVQRLFFTQDSALTRIYIGEPAFAHVNVEMLSERVAYYLTKRQDLYFPLICISLWTWISRNPYLLLGYLAYLPWFLLNFLANSDIAGTLFSYYAYPFIVSLFWPLIAVALQTRASKARPDRTRAVFGFGVVVISSLAGLWIAAGPVLKNRLPSFSVQADRATVDTVHQFRTDLIRNQQLLGRLAADTSVISLAPDAFEPEQFIDSPENKQVDTVLFYEGGIGAATAKNLVETAQLTDLYRVKDSTIRVATNRSPQQLSLFTDTLLPVSILNHLISADPGVERNRDGVLTIARAVPSGPIIFRLYATLQPGKYTIRLRVKVDDLVHRNDPVFAVDIVHHEGSQAIVPRQDIRLTELDSTSSGSLARIRFEVPDELEVSDAEFRIWHLGNARIRVNEIQLIERD